jgi:dTDP-glucose pyrophosphorylase
MMTDLQSLSIPDSATGLEALEVLNRNCGQSAFILNDNSVLVGTLTDGDIRRGLLKGIQLSEQISSFMNTNYISYEIYQSSAEIVNDMKRHSLATAPIVDQTGRIVNIISSTQSGQSQYCSTPVVIMAGGKGTRLRPYTENCPKPMLEVAGRPILESIIERFTNLGFKDFYISVNYLKEQIIDYFGNGERFGANIFYLIEKHPLGTAGSLTLLPQEVNSPLLVINGDVLTKFNPIQLIQYHQESNSIATLCVRKHDTQISFGVVQEKNSRLISLIEKPTISSLINAGIYVISNKILKYLPENESFDMPSLLTEALHRNLDVSVYPIHEQWIDIGRHDTLKEAENSWID